MTRRTDETIPLRDPEPARAPARPMYSARYYARLPPAPTLPDRTAALAYLTAVRDVLDQDHGLSRCERSALLRLQRRWAKRATGQDPRWNVLGARPGRATKAIESTYQRPDPAWRDP